MRILAFGVVVSLSAGAFGGPPGARASAPTDAAPRASHAPAAPTAKVAPPAPARTPETERIFAEARLQFDAGQDHYAHQRYQEAIRSFQAGYALVPRPNFLVNIGQSYRKLGNLVRAKEAYVAYVRALPENSPLRDQALQVLAEIEVQLQDGRDSEMRFAAGSQAGARARSEATASNPVPPWEQTATNTNATTTAAGRSRLGTWLGVGVGGIGLGLAAAGIGFQWRARQASEALAHASDRGDAFDAREEQAGQRAERFGNGFLVAGGAVMAAGLILFLIVDGSPNAAPGGVALRPHGVDLSWRF